MTLVVCLPYSGFVPGQIIPVTIELDNNSNVAIDAVKAKLERVIFLCMLYFNYLIYNKLIFLELDFQSKAP